MFPGMLRGCSGMLRDVFGDVFGRGVERGGGNGGEGEPSCAQRHPAAARFTTCSDGRRNTIRNTSFA